MALAFGAGLGVMVIELAGARLMAPTFGLSAVPWTAVIGVILAALAGGNWLGGRLADGSRVPLSAVLGLAGLTALVPVFGGAVPGAALARLGFVGGAVAAAVVLFAPSVVALGCVVPYLVRMETGDVSEVGRRAGDVGAAATVGSILGTFLTGFVLLPAFPLPLLLGVTAGLFFVLAAAARVRERRGPHPVVLLAAAAAAGAAGHRVGATLPTDVVAREESVYGSIEVRRRVWPGEGPVLELWQNGGLSSAEYVESGEPAHRYVVAAGWILDPVIERIDSVLVLGGAANSLAVAFERWRPELEIDVVEIDPAVTRLAREHFAFGEMEPGRIRVVHADARRYMETTERRYDLIVVDVYDHLYSVPWTMATREALELMARRLTGDGIVVVNVLAPLAGEGAAFLRRYLATVETVFPRWAVHPVTEDRDPATIQSILVVAARRAGDLPRAGWPRRDVEPRGPPLTDAHAPVEHLLAKGILAEPGW